MQANLDLGADALPIDKTDKLPAWLVAAIPFFRMHRLSSAATTLAMGGLQSYHAIQREEYGGLARVGGIALLSLGKPSWATSVSIGEALVESDSFLERAGLLIHLWAVYTRRPAVLAMSLLLQAGDEGQAAVKAIDEGRWQEGMVYTALMMTRIAGAVPQMCESYRDTFGGNVTQEQLDNFLERGGNLNEHLREEGLSSNLEGLEINGAEGVTFDGLNLKSCKLENLKETEWSNTTLNKCDLRGGQGANFTGVEIWNSNCEGASFGCFDQSFFYGCNLRDASFGDAIESAIFDSDVKGPTGFWQFGCSTPPPRTATSDPQPAN